MNKFRILKLIGLVCILAVFLVFIGYHFLQAQGKPDKDKPPGKGKPGTEPLQFDPPNIVTTEENALRVWKCNIDPYDPINPIWSTKTPGYNSVAVGDVDDDGNLEIVVPEMKETRKKGGCKACAGPFKIFLNVYKEGEGDIWESTEDYGEGVNGGYVVDPARPAKVMIADFDQDGADEVILCTFNYLAVFKYEDGMLKIVSQINMSELGLEKKTVFYAATSGDINQDGDKELIVYVKKWEEGFDEGWIYIFDKDLIQFGNLIYISGISSEGEDLRVANLDGDSDTEICLTGDHGSLEKGYLPYVFVWDRSGAEWSSSEVDIDGWYQDPSNPNPYTGLDVGELDGNSDNGEEIVVYSNLPDTSDYQLIIYKYDQTNGIYWLDNFSIQVQANISNVEIGDVVNDGYEGNEIVAAGRATLGTRYVFYLEVFDSNLNISWQRVGESKEGRVFDTAIVKEN